MKKLILAIFTAGIAVSCATVRNTTAKVEKGNYDDAIEVAVHKLRKNPEKKRKQEYVLLLETSYQKAVQRDIARIEGLASSGSSAHLQELYDLYLGLEARQVLVGSVAPLNVLQENRRTNLPMTDYSVAITSTRDTLVNHLYTQAQNALNNAYSKEDYRQIYDDLAYIQEIKRDFKNVKALMQMAYTKGIDYIHVSLYNDSQIALPIVLERELLDFSSYGLDNFWTVYHSTIKNDIDYDYTIDVAFTEINITPEFVDRNTYKSEKVIVDGIHLLEDEDGNLVLDEEGHTIEIENVITVRARYSEFAQNKAVSLVGEVQYTDARTGHVLNAFPLSSEFIFGHQYARYRGDVRALNPEMVVLTNTDPLPFPTNEQMIYDAGRDLKNRLKSIIAST